MQPSIEYIISLLITVGFHNCSFHAERSNFQLGCIVSRLDDFLTL